MVVRVGKLATTLAEAVFGDRGAALAEAIPGRIPPNMSRMAAINPPAIRCDDPSSRSCGTGLIDAVAASSTITAIAGGDPEKAMRRLYSWGSA